MRRIVLWIAAILITFAIGVGADRLWWHFLAAPPAPPKVEPLVVDVQPIRDTVLVPVPAAPAPPKPNLILDYDPLKFQLWAVFEIMGPTPKEFADFDSMEFMLEPESSNTGSIIVRTRKGNEYYNAEANFALVTERKVFFATSRSEDGEFEYRFDGEFLRTDLDNVAGKNKAVLRGTLTRMKNGRTVTQHEFSFKMEYMGC